MLYRPVWSNPPMISYTDLVDGSVSLEDIDRMNEALDVRDENLRLHAEWQRMHPYG